MVVVTEAVGFEFTIIGRVGRLGAWPNARVAADPYVGAAMRPRYIPPQDSVADQQPRNYRWPGDPAASSYTRCRAVRR